MRLRFVAGEKHDDVGTVSLESEGWGPSSKLPSAENLRASRHPHQHLGILCALVVQLVHSFSIGIKDCMQKPKRLQGMKDVAELFPDYFLVFQCFILEVSH